MFNESAVPGKSASLVPFHYFHYLAYLEIMEAQDKKPPFWKLSKPLMPEDASKDDLLEAAANLNEFMLVAYHMHLRLESEW